MANRRAGAPRAVRASHDARLGPPASLPRRYLCVAPPPPAPREQVVSRVSSLSSVPRRPGRRHLPAVHRRDHVRAEHDQGPRSPRVVARLQADGVAVVAGPASLGQNAVGAALRTEDGPCGPAVVLPGARDRRTGGHLTVTVAPAPSRAALALSAASLATFSRTGFGAPSTRSLASLRPSEVSPRTSLMTWIFLSPAASRTTSNSSCSAAASSPPPPPPPAGGTAAAATRATAGAPQGAPQPL